MILQLRGRRSWVWMNPGGSVPGVKLPYRNGITEVETAGETCIAPEVLPPAISDIAGTLLNSFEKPVSSHPLRDMIPTRGPVSILVPDITRGKEVKRVLPVLLKEISSCGVNDDRIGILIANGAHRLESDRELEVHLGGTIAGRYTVYQHRADHSDSHVRVGSTPHDRDLCLDRRLVDSELLIPVSGVSFHYFAGFGGGRKMIMPGMASIDSIMRNHRLSLGSDPGSGMAEGCFAGNLQGNPVHREMVAAAGLLDTPVFMINFIADPEGNIIFINSGDILHSHLKACEYLRQVYAVKLERQFPSVLISCGGSPRDINLLQAHKALRYGSAAAERGGNIYCVAACSEGIGSSSYREAAGMRRFREEDYSLNMQTAVSTRELTTRYNIHLKSELDDLEVERFGFIPWHERKIPEGDTPVLVIKNGSSFLPELAS
ncbi:MAG: nickel-dependent lactate racemase [Candidatus Latescibacteria bacterium]|nr:nickel-dependent lactate racemase [bacterium]MBD3425540.1 nickel-dependent lactate racemase [Candidatus Latescibacterota bacterium]